MEFVKRTYEVENPGAIRSVVILDADVPVEVITSGDVGMRATYFESEKEQYDIEVDGDTLYIRKKTRFTFGLRMFFSTPAGMRLTMYLPAGYAGDLSVTTADGGIRVFGVTASAIAMRTADGDINVNQTRIDRELMCKTVDGNIAVGSISAMEATLKTTDGDILLDRPLIANRITCRATDGDIRGLLAGRESDYSFSVRKIDGHSNIRSGGTGKTLLEAKTVDGDIAMSFVDGN